MTVERAIQNPSIRPAQFRPEDPAASVGEQTAGFGAIRAGGAATSVGGPTAGADAGQAGGPAASVGGPTAWADAGQAGGPAASVEEQTVEFGAIQRRKPGRGRRPRDRPVRDGGQERPAAAGPGTMFPPPTIAALCDEFTEVCESAVDALEIASALEFEGISDRTASMRYGAGMDVFALAQEMYFRVPRRPAEPEPPPDPWRQVSKYQPALRGLVYGLPAMCFLAAGSLLAGPGALTVLVVALLAGWGLSQGLATLGYLRLSATGTGQAQRLLRVGLAVGLTLVAAIMTATAFVVHPRIPVLVFGGGEGAYMLGACVLLVLGAERWLLAVLAPAVLSSAAFLLLLKAPGLEHMAWGGLAVTLLLALVLAVAFTSRPGPPAGRLLVATELSAALPAVGFGLVAAGLLVFPVVAGPEGHGGVNVGALLAAVPLSLSMGTAEWSLLRYRRRTRRLLRATRELGKFGLRARLALLGAVLEYLAGAVALTAAAIGLAAVTGLVHPHWSVMPEVGVYLALGAVMFLALLLQAVRARGVPLAAAAAALALEVTFRDLGLVVQVAAVAGLLAVVGGYAAVMLGQAVRNAC
jgi:hypothetical protein